jgi:hypothetical protein
MLTRNDTRKVELANALGLTWEQTESLIRLVNYSDDLSRAVDTFRGGTSDAG